jgi:hypothetical protein
MKNKFIISENEKNRILGLHVQKILIERNRGKVEISEQAETPKELDPTIETPTLPKKTEVIKPPVTPRYKTAVCPDGKVRCNQTVLRVQIRMNDECDDIAQTKLVEDGILGVKTNSAWSSCKSKLKPTKQVQGSGGQEQGTKVSQIQGGQVKTDEPITANDIATLTT